MVYICYVFSFLAYFIIEYQQSLYYLLVIVDVFDEFSCVLADTYELFWFLRDSAYRLYDFCRVIGDDDVVVF